jgi:hypothetical protein
MQYKKILAAGALAALMVGSSVAFAATLADYPSPFVTSDGMQSLVVVGAVAAPSDVVGAVDVATRLGGEVTTDYICAGATGTVTVSGEGKEISTTNTKLYLADNLGKSGVRTTMTKDDLPTILANGVLEDTDASTTHNFQQFIYLTPVGTAANYRLDFERPSSTASDNPTYSIGRFSTSPSTTDYLYRVYVTFDKDVNGSTAVGEKITLFGNEYTISSGTSTAFTGATTDKLVLFGGAETKVIGAGETLSTTLGGTAYDVTLVGVASGTQVVVKVGTDQQSITKGTSKKVGGLDVYVDDAYYLSSTDQTQNSAKIMLGAEKLTFQYQSKVKIGDTEDNVDGTYVSMTTSAGKLVDLTVYVGAKSSTNDYIKAGDTYTDPVFKSFSIAFPSVTPGLTDATRSVVEVTPSGDNLLQLSMMDDRGNQKTIYWGYKASATGQTFSLADNSANNIEVMEGANIARDEQFIVDSGDFTHMFKLASASMDASTSSNVELTDMFSGATTKVTLGTDNKETKYIDGQAYYIQNHTTANEMRISWGTGASAGVNGTWTTVYPVLKTKGDAHVALTKPNMTIPLITTGMKIELPTGAFNLTGGAGGVWTVAAVDREDGSASALGTGGLTSFNTTNLDALGLKLGKTATGGTYYILKGTGATSMTISLGSQANNVTSLEQPAVLLVEEKDDAGAQYSVVVAGSTETSGSNYVAIPAAPVFTYDSTYTGVAQGTDSTIYEYVDLYGVYAKRTTSGQDTVKLYYPNDQAVANFFVLGEGATTSATGSSAGATVKQAVAVKTPLGKLDSEITSSDKSTKNLILVGGPAVNTLVAELADGAKTKDRAWYVAQGAGTAIIDLVADAFTSGKSALVIAGHSADDTRAAAKIMQTYDMYAADFAAKSTVVIKNGVIGTATA